MAEQEAIGLLEQLARDFNVRDPRKLQQIARQEFPDRRDLTAERARTALRSDVARQVLAPKPRSLGKSAAEGPDQRLQADLVDFSQNTRGPNRYGLVVTDVFTREVATKALPNKQSGTVTQAAAEIIPELVEGEGNYVVTTDQANGSGAGGSPAGAGGAPGEAAERPERHGGDRPGHPDAEEGPGGEGGPGRRRLGRARGRGDGSLQRPAAPGGDGGAGGRGDEAGGDLPGVRDNAEKFEHNKNLTEGRQRRLLEEAGAFRAPTNAARSFQPQYGAVRELAGYDSMTVRATDGSETLLKHALPVPRGSGEPRGVLPAPAAPPAAPAAPAAGPGRRTFSQMLRELRDGTGS